MTKKLKAIIGLYNLKGEYTARDVANYIVKVCAEKNLSITNLQLQKILYYIQVYFLQKEKLFQFLS